LVPAAHFHLSIHVLPLDQVGLSGLSRNEKVIEDLTIMEFLTISIQLTKTDASIDGVSSSETKNLDVTGIGPEQFACKQQTEISVNVSLMNLHATSPPSSITITSIINVSCEADDDYLK